MSGEALLAWALLAPLAQAGAALLSPRGLRGMAHAALGAAAAAPVALLLARAFSGAPPAALTLAEPAPGAALAFAAEPLGLLFAAVVTLAATLLGLHALGFLAAARTPAPGRILAAMAGVTGGAVGVAFASTLFSFVLALVVLTLFGAVLIAAPDDARARRAASLHLTTLLAAALGLVLPAAGWVHAIAGEVAFRTGGVLGGALAPGSADLLLAMFVLGLAHAGFMPAHRALTAAATAAPAPGSALLIVASGGAGVFGVLKVLLYTFGPALAEAQNARVALAALGYGGALLTAALALAQQDLRERLAYVCVSQIALAVAGALAGTPAALFGAALHLAAFGFSAATMFMALGAIEAVTGRTQARELAGLGRVMPIAFTGFALGALGLAGAPPLAGAWSRLWLAAGAAETGAILPAFVQAICGGLAFAAFAPQAVRASFAASPGVSAFKPDAGAPAIIAPIALAACVLVALVAFVQPLAGALRPALGASIEAKP